MMFCPKKEGLDRFLNLAANVSKKHRVGVGQLTEHAKEGERGGGAGCRGGRTAYLPGWKTLRRDLNRRVVL